LKKEGSDNRILNIPVEGVVQEVIDLGKNGD